MACAGRGKCRTATECGSNLRDLLLSKDSQSESNFVGFLARECTANGPRLDTRGVLVLRAGAPHLADQALRHPQETAPLVAYVASTLASAPRGATLRIDGGVVKRVLNSGAAYGGDIPK